jgi:hypothetical protein
MIPHSLLNLLFGEEILSQAGQEIAAQAGQDILAMTDCDWVRIIYQKMGGNLRRIPEDCCRTYGVACVGDHVTGVYWSNKDLTGSIPPELGMLAELQYL